MGGRGRLKIEQEYDGLVEDATGAGDNRGVRRGVGSKTDFTDRGGLTLHFCRRSGPRSHAPRSPARDRPQVSIKTPALSARPPRPTPPRTDPPRPGAAAVGYPTYSGCRGGRSREASPGRPDPPRPAPGSTRRPIGPRATGVRLQPAGAVASRRPVSRRGRAGGARGLGPGR